MNKMIISILLIFGLVGMIGTVTAGGNLIPAPLEINPDSSISTQTTYTMWYLTTVPQDETLIKIYKDVNGNDDLDAGDILTSTDLQVDWNNDDYSSNTPIDGTTWFTVGGSTYDDWDAEDADTIPAADGETLYTKYIKIRNNPSNDNAQPGDKYIIQIYSSAGNVEGFAQVAKSNASVIPEFPTIALPIAAILGLMFIISSRKKKE